MIRTGRRRLLVGGSALLVGGLAGCTNQDADEDPSERGPLSVADFAFAAEEPTGYGEYTEQPDATYARGETLWLYVELDGLAGEPVDDGVQIDLEQVLRLEHEEHGQISETPDVRDDVLQSNQLERFSVQNGFEIGSQFATGEYTLTMSFTDNVSETSATESGTFHVAE